jgi:hypothetical protein
VGAEIDRRYGTGAFDAVFQESRQRTEAAGIRAVRNPMQFEGYGEHCWGFTACDGPGWVKRVVDGVERRFAASRLHGRLAVTYLIELLKLAPYEHVPYDKVKLPSARSKAKTTTRRHSKVGFS